MSDFEQKKEELAEYLDERDRAVEEKDGWKFGERVRVLEDDENEGLYTGDEGLLIIERVGAPEHGNERVAFFIVDPGVRDPIEIEAYNFEAA